MATELTPVAPREYSHWDGTGRASGYSRAVAEASVRVYRAKADLLRVLEENYPIDAPVTVIHWRGAFSGTVCGWDTEGIRVFVKNDRSGKVSKWWAAHVELQEPQNG